MNIWDAAERAARLRLRWAGIAGRTFDGPAGPVHTYDARGGGPRPPTVLLHGIGSSATAYGRLLRGLAPRVSRVVAPDLPGHGFSAGLDGPPHPQALAEQAVAIVDALVDDLGGRAVVVGTSMGGALALRYALARPERVEALVLCSPAGAPLDADALDALRADFDVADLADARAFVERLFAGRPPAPGLVARAVRDRLSRPVVQGLLARVGPDDFLDPQAAAALDPPTLLLWGTAERVLPEHCLTWYRRHLPGRVCIECPEGWGHSAHLEHTAELVDRVCRFVDDAVSRRPQPSDGGCCPKTAGEAPSTPCL